MSFLRKSPKKIEDEAPPVDYYCEHCEKFSKYFLRTINLAREIIFMRCPHCEKILRQEDFHFKRKKLVVEDEWAIAGTRVIGDKKEPEQFDVGQTDTDFTPKRKAKAKYKCKQCEELFNSPVELRWHNSKMHQLRKKEPKPAPPKKEEPVYQNEPSLEDVENQDIPYEYDDSETNISKD